MVAANTEAVIIVGTLDAVAAAIRLVNRDLHPVFMTTSFAGGYALAKKLGGDGPGVYVTQVVPLPKDVNITSVARYRAALSHYDPRAEPGFVSLEGYLAGRLAIAGVEACGHELSRQCFIEALRGSNVIDIDGFRVRFGPDGNQGSDAVFLTVIDADGKYRKVEKITKPREP